nr:hypothetical protein [Lachnospiraceae bacterium]
MLKGFWKTKQGRLLLLAEAVVLLLLLGITVFHKNDVIRISAKQYSVSGGTYDAASCWCIASEHTDTPFVTIGPLCLDRGVYRVVLPYGEDTAGDSLICVAEDGVTTGVYTNGATLYHGRSSTSFQMWVLKPVDTLTLQVLYSGNGSLLVGDLDIVETSGLYRGILVIVFLLMLTLNLVVSRMVQRRFPVQAVGVLVITALASIPLCKNYTISGGDLIFHLMRIEGVKDGLLSGQFPVRIAPKWLCGYGYASSVFYGEILLYFPALLRLAGFSVQAAYKMLLFAINLGTAFISYDCFTKIAKDKWTGLIAALLYTLSPDRLFSQYVYAALGRAGAMMFLPFIALGFYQLYTRETEDADYWKGGVFLTLGFSGLIQTHSLSGMITVIFSVLLCALLALRTFRKKTLAVIGGAAGITLLLNAWFIVPFLDFVRRGDFIMEHTSERTIQSVGLPFSQLMGLFIRRGS